MVAPPGCCEICQIAEVLADPELQNRSVRITGKLEMYDAQRKLARISFQDATMTVETQRLALENLRLQLGSMYQFLGETAATKKVVELLAHFPEHTYPMRLIVPLPTEEKKLEGI
ncbi:Hypothetical protein PHPALM_5769 [Phytophthora palmivora]|uniref:Uncharacterized protein n=1 Tax=Phytophthora palmivora TaxID=4796 RepID=A0A2P4YGJ1_9STRA|nr:Hypothetical protein PHPALM_5769 [Phytophthora palmivora]